MKNHVSVLARLSILAAALVVVTSFLPAHAAGAGRSTADLLQRLSKVALPPSAGQPSEILAPPTHDTRPFRQFVSGFCQVPKFDNICRYVFNSVPQNKLLEINNIMCYSSTGGAGFIITKAPNPQGVNAFFAAVLGVLPPGNTSLDTASASGPFYFKAGEALTIWAAGTSGAGTVNICSAFGQISSTN